REAVLLQDWKRDVEGRAIAVVDRDDDALPWQRCAARKKFIDPRHGDHVIAVLREVAHLGGESGRRHGQLARLRAEPVIAKDGNRLVTVHIYADAVTDLQRDRDDLAGPHLAISIGLRDPPGAAAVTEVAP